MVYTTAKRKIFTALTTKYISLWYFTKKVKQYQTLALYVSQKRNNCKITFLIGFGLDKVMCQYWLPSRYEYRFRFNLLLKATFYIRWGLIMPILVFNKYTKYLIKLRNEFFIIKKVRIIVVSNFGHYWKEHLNIILNWKSSFWKKNQKSWIETF